VKIKRKDNRSGMVAHVYPFADNEHVRIRVERGREFGEPGWEPEARVHWSAFMPQGVEFARQYAEAILEACRIGEEMNAVPDHEHTTPGGYMVEYQRGHTVLWERVEEGAEVPMYDGFTVAKVPPRHQCKQ
jgi:hypothetical protein